MVSNLSPAGKAAASTRENYTIRDFREVLGKNDYEYYDFLEEHNYRTLWTFVANGILALFLLAGPYFIQYGSKSLTLSDTVAGIAVMLLELFAFSPRRVILRWGTVAVGFWLLLAPLIFWAPNSAVYLADTLIGCLLMTFAVLIPGVPGKGGARLLGPDHPPGWSYNPSSWIRRWLGIGLALAGFFMARYLAAHQLGYIPHAWDPFFGTGSDRVTGSALSRSFPISDAGFGAVAYIMETMTGFMGDRARWRTAPFIAVMFALLVIPLGATSIILVIMQPVMVGAWCGLCLISAAALLASVPLAVHEAIAVGQFLMAAHKQGKNLWRVFWFGGSISGAGASDPDRRRWSLARRWVASVQGVTLPWAIVGQLVVGAWLMARPDIIHASMRLANIDHIFGALVVTVAAIATAEVTRLARYVNLSLGFALVGCAFAFALSAPIVFCSQCFCGIVLTALSLPRGEIAERYGPWDKFVV